MRGKRGHVTKLYVGEKLEVYYQINPQWMDLDITDISERELRQFPNLTSITFNMYHAPSEELVEKLKSWGIEVHTSD